MTTKVREDETQDYPDWSGTLRGNTYSDLGEYEKALDDYDKAIELDPKYVKAYSNRGNAYKAMDEYERLYVLPRRQICVAMIVRVLPHVKNLSPHSTRVPLTTYLE